MQNQAYPSIPDQRLKTPQDDGARLARVDVEIPMKQKVEISFERLFRGGKPTPTSTSKKIRTKQRRRKRDDGEDFAKFREVFASFSMFS